MDNKRPLVAHLSILAACIFWGLMAPVGKDAMSHGINGVDLVTFRVAGAAVLFWLASLFVKREHVPVRDIVKLFFAGLFGLVFNQCCYIIGLSMTSPINASIVTTSAPIFAMVLSALILKEPITGKKAIGVLMGFSGALILILTSASATSAKVGDIRGDLLCLFAQFSFALYLALFRPLVQRYSVFTINKWMFTFATIVVLPFTAKSVTNIDPAAIPASAWWEAIYVVVVGTFLCYILMMMGQRTLRPTVVSIYNYLQPVVSVVVSVAIGLGVFGITHALAVVLVFGGVWLVTKSKSRADMEREAEKQ